MSISETETIVTEEVAQNYADKYWFDFMYLSKVEIKELAFLTDKVIKQSVDETLLILLDFFNKKEEYRDKKKITLTSLEHYLDIYKKINNFLKKRCIDYLNIESPDHETKGIMSDLFHFEIDDKNNQLDIVFRNDYSERPFLMILPLDILFDEDYCEKLKIRFDEQRKKEEADKKERELKLFEELKKKYGV